MAEPQTLRLDTDHREALGAMVEDGEADDNSDALRQTSRATLRRRGYMDGANGDSRLRYGIRVAGALFLVSAVAWIGLTFFFPVAWRLPAVGMVLSGAVCFGADRVLARVEPDVSARLRGFVGGERAS